MPSRVHAAALSDVGCVRSNNEDAFAVDPARGLYVVCDGMGGRAAGEVASALASKNFLSAFATAEPESDIPAAMRDAIQQANAAVWQAAAESGQGGMGTTLVAAAIAGETVFVANVGDSRAYLLRDETCTQITADHSYVNELILSGSIREEDRRTPRIRRLESVITRAVGTAEVVEADTFEIALEHGDVVLLASDGLTRYLDSAELAALINPSELEFSCARLVGAANDAGGVDNITCVLLRYEA